SSACADAVPVRPDLMSKSSTGSMIAAALPSPPSSTWLHVPVPAWWNGWTRGLTSGSASLPQVGVQDLHQAPGGLAHALLGQRAVLVEVGPVHLVGRGIDATGIDQATRLAGPGIRACARAIGGHRRPGQGIETVGILL